MGYNILGKLAVFATLAGGAYDVYQHVGNFLSNGQDLQHIQEQGAQLNQMASTLENCFKNCAAKISLFSSDAYCRENCQEIYSLYNIAVGNHNAFQASALRNFEASKIAAIAAIGITIYLTYPLICKAASRVLQSFVLIPQPSLRDR